MPQQLRSLTSFNHYPVQTASLIRPEIYRQLNHFTGPTISRGLGSSYGDAALNQEAQVILMERLDRILAFNAQTGSITCEAGLSLDKLLQFIVPKGWFIPVTPGTAYVSLGGCFASDVHGKNHHRVGSFAQHVSALELITSSGQAVYCSPEKNSELFWATAGGMGLTGIIGQITLQLIPITTAYMYVRYFASHDLEQTFMYLNSEPYDDLYHVAWLDLLNAPLGRGIVMAARHASLELLPAYLQTNALNNTHSASLSLPMYFPNWFLHKQVGKQFNRLYYQCLRKKTAPFITHYRRYFYPLDRIKHWGKLYGTRGFIQYQCVLPQTSAQQTTKILLELIQNSSYPVLLATLKRLGTGNDAPLSFAAPGFTLALDIPILDPGLFLLLQKLDQHVIEANGKIYLAKDARLTPQAFRDMYPHYNRWLTIKRSVDPQNLFSSSLSRRLQLC